MNLAMRQLGPAVTIGLLLAAGGSSAAELKRDESVIIFPAIAWPADEPGRWQSELRVWVGEPEPRGVSLAALRQALSLATELTAAEAAIFNERARWFLADNERGKEINVGLGTQRVTLGPTTANGYATTSVTLDLSALDASETAAGRIELTLASGGAGATLSGELFLVPPEGVSVISDIDDTIKVTEVRDKSAMLRNTFLRPFKPVPGMAALYSTWLTNRAVQFHYVSASPWQLYPALAAFRQTNGFPAGTFHLKTFRWKDETFLDLFQSPVEYKLAVIEPLLKKFPGRRFLLVGDSGEADPEVYGELARRHPLHVERILIRNVTGEGRDAARYVSAFREVPPGKWELFKTADQVNP